MTEKQLTKLLHEWQRLLRLADWNITLFLEDDTGDFGETRFDKYKNAHITLCTEETLPRGCPGVKDIEVTLVHELLHLGAARLTMGGIEPDSPTDDALEEFIELTAQSLVALKRSCKQVPTKFNEATNNGSSARRPRGHAVQRPAAAKRGR